MIEKQAQIVVKPRVVSEEEKQRKAALLAQYADVTDEEDEADEKADPGASTANIGSDKSLFRNTNVEDVLNARKLSETHFGMSPKGRRSRTSCRGRRTN